MHSDVIDIAIGCVFVWFLLSSVLSAINEAIAWSTHLRAKHLWLGIGRILNPDTSPLPKSLLDAVWRLPVQGKGDVRPTAVGDGAGSQNNKVQTRLSRPTVEDAAVRGRLQKLYAAMAPQIAEISKPGRLSKVTHVASSAVSAALLELASTVHHAELVAAAVDLGWSDAKRLALEAMLDKAPAIADRDQVTLEDLNTRRPDDLTEAELADLYDHALAVLSPRDAASYLADNPALAQALRRAMAGVTGNEKVLAAKATIDAWFDREMDQISRLYRRQNRKFLAILAVPLVLVLQANAIGFALDLKHDQQLREGIVSAAIGASQADTVTKAINDPKCDVARPADEAAPTTSTSASTTTTSPVDAAAQNLKCAGAIVAKASAFHVGWAWHDFTNASDGDGNPDLADVWPFLINDWGWIGRALTLVALLFGAQFWFDLLRRLVGIRTMLTTGGSAAG